MSDKLSIPDALYWSFERNLHGSSLELVSDRDAEVVVAAAATAICYQNKEHDSPDAYRRLKVEVYAMLHKAHLAWSKDRREDKA
jgi:hypothetical protein